MKKDILIPSIVKWLKIVAEENNMEVIDRGVGRAFENTPWEGLLDDSNIPNIIVQNVEQTIQFRSFWGNPEVDIHRKNGDMLIFNYTDTVRCDDGRFKHTGDYKIRQLRVDCDGDYKNKIEEMYSIIDQLQCIYEEIENDT